MLMHHNLTPGLGGPQGPDGLPGRDEHNGRDGFHAWPRPGWEPRPTGDIIDDGVIGRSPPSGPTHGVSLADIEGAPSSTSPTNILDPQIQSTTLPASRPTQGQERDSPDQVGYLYQYSRAHSGRSHRGIVLISRVLPQNPRRIEPYPDSEIPSRNHQLR